MNINLDEMITLVWLHVKYSERTTAPWYRTALAHLQALDLVTDDCQLTAKGISLIAKLTTSTSY